jgi:hypothetical protein
MEIAKTILSQLGNNKFIAMTGAKSFVAGTNSLSFRIPKAKQSINYVKITLNSLDLYDMEFGRIRANTYKVVETANGVYNDQLQKLFTSNTGLHTYL